MRLVLTGLDASLAFFNKTYGDAVDLLVEARNYVAFRKSSDSRDLDMEARLLVSQETLRITSRLTQVMAWLLSQRAVQHGEMTPEEALSDAFAISGESVCADDRWTRDERLPEAVRSLLERSLNLYNRVRRLEDMQRRHYQTSAG